MGSCTSQSSNDVIQLQTVKPKLGNKPLVRPDSSSKQQNKISDTDPESYNIMISYCWTNKEVCHALADRLISDKIKVWIDRDKMSGDIYASMADAVDNSDCILLCISESYFNSVNCQREARYAADRHRLIIPIKVTPKYEPVKWLGLIIAGKLYFNLSVSYDSFESNYAKIKEEAVGTFNKNFI